MEINDCGGAKYSGLVMVEGQLISTASFSSFQLLHSAPRSSCLIQEQAECLANRIMQTLLEAGNQWQRDPGEDRKGRQAVLHLAFYAAKDQCGKNRIPGARGVAN